MGVSLLSFVLSYMTKSSPPERREASFASRLVTKSIVSCHTDTSRLSGGDLFITARPRMRFAVSVRSWGGQNWESIFEKTRVGFGRTELSLPFCCTVFCALSSGHGPRVLGFQGGSSWVDFHVFQGCQKSANKNSLHFSTKIKSLTIGG